MLLALRAWWSQAQGLGRVIESSTVSLIPVNTVRCLTIEGGHAQATNVPTMVRLA